MRKPKNKTDYVKELHDAFERWEHLYHQGGHDPFWSDGTNMNLIRNHISYYKDKIEEIFSTETYPEIYYRELPPEMPQDYIARADEIRESAKLSLSLYKSDSDRLFLEKILNSLSKKNIQNTSILNVLSYKEVLEQAIQNDDLITMRRHENPKYYLQSFAQCVKRIKDIKPPDNEQISLFEFDDCEPDNSENDFLMSL